MRVGFDQSKVAEYTELWKQGVIFPPLDIFADVKGDKKDRVADGFHRLLAAIAANIERSLQHLSRRFDTPPTQSTSIT